MAHSFVRTLYMRSQYSCGCWVSGGDKAITHRKGNEIKSINLIASILCEMAYQVVGFSF